MPDEESLAGEGLFFLFLSETWPPNKKHYLTTDQIQAWFNTAKTIASPKSLEFGLLKSPGRTAIEAEGGRAAASYTGASRSVGNRKTVTYNIDTDKVSAEYGKRIQTLHEAREKRTETDPWGDEDEAMALTLAGLCILNAYYHYTDNLLNQTVSGVPEAYVERLPDAKLRALAQAGRAQAKHQEELAARARNIPRLAEDIQTRFAGFIRVCQIIAFTPGIVADGKRPFPDIAATLFPNDLSRQKEAASYLRSYAAGPRVRKLPKAENMIGVFGSAFTIGTATNDLKITYKLTPHLLAVSDDIIAKGRREFLQKDYRTRIELNITRALPAAFDETGDRTEHNQRVRDIGNLCFSIYAETAADGDQAVFIAQGGKTALNNEVLHPGSWFNRDFVAAANAFCGLFEKLEKGGKFKPFQDPKQNTTEDGQQSPRDPNFYWTSLARQAGLDIGDILLWAIKVYEGRDAKAIMGLHTDITRRALVREMDARSEPPPP